MLALAGLAGAGSSARAAVNLEYPVDSVVANTTVTSLAPSVNTMDAGSLGGSFVQSIAENQKIWTQLPQLFVADPAAIANPRANQYFEFTVNQSAGLSIDYANAAMNFGASSHVLGGAFAVFLEAQGNTSFIGSSNFLSFAGSNVSVDLSGIPAQSSAHTFIITPWMPTAGDIINTIALDANGTLNNLTIQDAVVSASPVPEPHEYALLAGFGLVGFAVYRRRLMNKSDVELPDVSGGL